MVSFPMRVFEVMGHAVVESSSRSNKRDTQAFLHKDSFCVLVMWGRGFKARGPGKRPGDAVSALSPLGSEREHGRAKRLLISDH